MRHIIDNFYFEEATGFTYEKKTFNGAFYFVPLNYCILENKQIIDKINYGRIHSKSKAVQEHRRYLQLCRQPQPGIGSRKLRSQLGVRVGTPGRLKILYNQCPPGSSSVYRNIQLQTSRRNSVYHILRTSSATNLYGIRPKGRSKIGGVEKEKISHGRVNEKNVQQSIRGIYNHRGKLC